MCALVRLCDCVCVAFRWAHFVSVLYDSFLFFFLLLRLLLYSFFLFFIFYCALPHSFSSSTLPSLVCVSVGQTDAQSMGTTTPGCAASMLSRICRSGPSQCGPYPAMDTVLRLLPA